MKHVVVAESAHQIDADAVVVGIFTNESLGGAAEQIDHAADGLLTRLIQEEELRGDRNDLLPLYGLSGVRATQVIVLGLGPRDAFDCGVAYQAAAAAAHHLSKRQRQRVAYCLADEWNSELMESVVAGAMVGCQGQDLYRTEKKQHPFEVMLWNTDSSDALERGAILGRAVNCTRRLVNEPPANMTPAAFADRAVQMATSTGLDAEVWSPEQLEKERCGALLAVARGSANPPQLVILRHKQSRDEGAPTLALVGKGVTFDSGGLSLKPNDGMKTMKCDMAGAATVLGVMQAIAELQLPVNVIGLMGLVENMPGRDAYKLGDVLTTRAGKTIEVHNTDAEGRLVLADVLSVAVDQGADNIVDLATLTGACVVALGMDVAGLMTNNQPLCDRIVAAAQQSGERVWQLPMFAEFDEQIRSKVADIKNVGSRWGGAITAAKLLAEFVADRPWVHIDIAGPAFLEESKPWMDGGGTGAMVRTLVRLVRDEAASVS